ncbi:hypothetical protein BsWGS_22708 [Bradybaena similaris]
MATTGSLLKLLTLLALSFSTAVKLKHSAIISHLRDTSERDVIPLPDDNNSPVTVEIDLGLIKILDVDQERNEIEVLMLQSVIYNNPALAWDVTKEGFNASYVVLNYWYLWQPDITVYNAVSRPEFVDYHLAFVKSNGDVEFIPKVRVRVWCDLQDVDSNSGANCSLKLGSWTQSGKTLSLSNIVNGISMYWYLATPKYEVMATSAIKHSKVYECCPDEPYEDLEFTFVVRKQDRAVRVPEEETGSLK